MIESDLNLLLQDRALEHLTLTDHLTALQAGYIAARAGVQRVIPIHFSPRYTDREGALRAEVAASFSHRDEIAPVGYRPVCCRT